MPMYVVIVCSPTNLGQGVAHAQAFTGADKDALIRRGIATKQEMERKSGEGKDYLIVAGEITDRVVIPVTYELVALQP